MRHYTVARLSPSSTGLSLGAKVGIGVAIPLVVIVAALVGIYCVVQRRRRRAGQNQEIDTSFPPETKPELYAGPADTSIAGPVRKKSELPTSYVASLPPELHDTTIAEADPNAWTPENKNRKRKPVAAASTASSHGGSERPLIPMNSDAGTLLQTTTTQSTEAELIEEADAAVQELGLLVMRKKTLVTQANALGRRPEELEGRKGEEYRELVLREEKVRKRLDDIEAERKGRAAPRWTANAALLESRSFCCGYI